MKASTTKRRGRGTVVIKRNNKKKRAMERERFQKTISDRNK